MGESAIDVIIGRIREMIISGELGAGARLPSEAVLAEMVGMSRNSVREAVRVLVTARVLDVRQGDGTYVTSLRAELLLEGLGFAVEMMQDESALELLEVRRVGEPQAAGLAAARVSPDQLQRISACLKRMSRAASHDEFVRADAEFHDLANRASGNQALAAILRGVSSSSHRARVWRDILESGASERTVSEHERIFEALRRGDSAEAEQAAREHVRSTEAWLLGVLEGAPGGPTAISTESVSTSATSRSLG